MSTAAALLEETLRPLVIVAALVCEWCAVWFTLGRTFVPTALLTVAANAVSLAGAWAVLRLHLLGPAAGSPAPGWGRWTGAYLLILGANFLVEALVLRTIMRRHRPGFHWNPYDLGLFLLANAVSLGIAGIGVWAAG